METKRWMMNIVSSSFGLHGRHIVYPCKRSDSTWKVTALFHALRSNHFIQADAYSSDSAAFAFRSCLPSCFANNSILSFLHSSTRFSYPSLFPNLSNNSSRTSSREDCVFLSFCCPTKCVFPGSQSSTNTLYISLCAIRFRSLAFSSPLTYLA